MLIVLNGFPGVGKLTIARELAKRTDAKLLDVHTEYNLAFALTEFQSDAFYQTIRKVWGISDPLVQALPSDTPVVLTTVMKAHNPSDGAWGQESWDRMLRLAESRGPLVWINLHCSAEENRRRIQSQERRAARKPRDVAMADRNQSGPPLFDGSGAAHVFELDVTTLDLHQSTNRILDWLEAQSLVSQTQ